MTHGIDPHKTLYRAAASALHEQTPSPRPCDLPSIGDGITFRVDGGYETGRVIDYLRGNILVETTDDIHEVHPEAVMPF